MHPPADPAAPRPRGGAGPASGRAPQRPEPLTGTVLEGRYRVGSRLARGGMSTVYRGLDLRLGRPVAIKVMTQQYAADPLFEVRFEREARAAAGLDDPAVVGVYDQGRDGDHVFLVMELVDGGTLRDLLHQRGALSVPVALSVLEPILSALSAAHAAGLVHRDVKPENVLISARGEVKVADFGLVRAVTSTTMATGNVILGTVAYLSPEQVATGAADERSDVYSAGIVAYEMLTGHPPFGGENALSVAYQHVHEDVPPVADSAPGVPVAIAAAVDAATSRDPLGRPVNAADFLRRIRVAREQVGLAPVAVPVPRPPRKRDPDRPPADGDEHRSTGAPGTHHESAAGAGPSNATTRDVASSTGRSGHTRVAGRGTAAAGRPDRLTAVQGAGATGRGATRRPRQRGGWGRSAGARQRSRWRVRLIVLVVLVLVAGAAAFGGWWLGGRWTSAPAVVGTPAQQAAAAVRDAGLVPALSTSHDNATPSGQVASADPPGGTRQLRGATVSLVVSSGRPVVPRVAPGSSVAVATALIRAADLTAVTDARRDVYDNAVPEGTVVRTEPAPGEDAKIGAHVLLVRSRGPVPTVVPAVAGKQPEDARNKLLVTGFSIGPSEKVFDPDAADGAVVGTDPPEGATAPHGSPVSLLIAHSLTVPDVSGATIDAAKSSLTEGGFDVTVGDPVFDPDRPAGEVVRTDPPTGTRIDPAHPAVTVIASNSVTVPPLNGMSVQQAELALTGAGLTTGDVYSLFGSETSMVTGQHPGAGTLVEPGSPVDLSAWP